MADLQRIAIDTRALREMIVRHKKTLVRGPLIGLALGAIVFLFAPRTYRSEARIFLRLGRESIGLDPTASTGQTLALQQADRKDEVKSAIDVLKSRSIIGLAVDKLGADAVMGRSAKGISIGSIVTAPLRWASALIKSVDPVSDREDAIIRVERHLYVNAERESTVIVVQYDANNPKLAQEVCDAVVDVYQHEHMRIHRSEESRPFFAEQQKRLRGELDEALERVRSMKNELGLSSIEQRRTSLESQFNAVELDRLSTEQQLATAQARIADLLRRLTDVPERLVGSKKSVPNQGADLLRQQLYALQVKAMALKARYNDTHPLVQAINEQLIEAKRVLAQQAGERTETTDDINTIHRDLSLEQKREQSLVAGFKARETELMQQKETVLAALRAVNDQDLKIDQLSRQADLARDRFMQYSRNMEEARIDKALENGRISNVSIVQAATLAEKPVSPSKPLIVVATLLLAIAGPIGVVLGSERFAIQLRGADVEVNGSDAPHAGDFSGRRVRRRILSRPGNGLPHTSPQPQPPG
jgi:uncharacterized protein involved in exopolysaccharide biosynthesis